MHERPVSGASVVAALAPPPMLQLRQATRLVHKRIEASLPVLDPHLTRERYTRVVEALHGFYAAVEPMVADALACGDDRWRQHAKLPLLATDLRALGRAPDHIDRLPRCTTMPYPRTASHALGILYVLEGATLGGQIIAKSLRARLAIEVDTGAAFFHGYGDATGSMWSRFSEHVDRSASIQTDAAISAAIETFQTLTQWLDTALAES